MLLKNYFFRLSDTASKLLKNKPIVFLVLFGFFVLFRPPVDPDFGWHYKYGEHFLRYGELLRENKFSHTLPQHEWATPYWLAQIVMAGPLLLFGEKFGAILLVLTLSAFLSIFYALLLFRLPITRIGAFLGGFVSFLGLRMYLLPVRPMFFSTIFFTILLYVLLYRKNLIKFIPLLFMLWVNLHPDWMLGLFVFAAYAGFDFLQKRKIDFFLIRTGILSGLATLVNPYFIDLHINLFGESGGLSFTTIGEFLPYSATDISFIFLVSSIALILASALMTKHTFDNWYLFVVAFFLLLSLRLIYFYRHFLLIGVFPLALYFGELINNVWDEFNAKEKNKISLAVRYVGYAVLLTSFVLFALNIHEALDTQRWSYHQKYPFGAVQYLKENSLEGNMYNDYNWGGYLIWMLPEYKTFVDGRMPAWRINDDFPYKTYHEFISIENATERMHALNEIVTKYDIGFLLIPQDDRLRNVVLEKNPDNWEVVYEDDIAVIIKNIKPF